MKEKTKKAIATAALVAALSLPATQAKADLKGSLEGIASEAKGASYMRAHGFYGLPGDIGGYTFIELYGGGKGYFGKTMLTKSLTKGIALKAEVLHIDEPMTMTGLGVEATVPTPKGTVLKVKGLPVYLDKTGHVVEGKKVIGYFASADLGKGWGLSSFADISVKPQGGLAWSYGEVCLEKHVWDGVSVTYSPALKATGKFAPHWEHRVSAKVQF